MGFLKKMKAKLEDLNGFLKENKSKIRGFPPIRGRMESMYIMIIINKINNYKIKYKTYIRTEIKKIYYQWE